MVDCKQGKANSSQIISTYFANSLILYIITSYVQSHIYKQPHAFFFQFLRSCSCSCSTRLPTSQIGSGCHRLGTLISAPNPKRKARISPALSDFAPRPFDLALNPTRSTSTNLPKAGLQGILQVKMVLNFKSRIQT